MHLQTIRQTLLRVLFALLPLTAGCGDDPPVAPPGPPAGPPGAIEATVNSAQSFPARKIEARLLQAPVLGAVSTGGEITVYTTPSVREPKEGGDMAVVRRAETNDFGKFKIDNIAPGNYLLSVGTHSTGIWREWVKVEPGKTVSAAVKLPGRK